MTTSVPVENWFVHRNILSYLCLFYSSYDTWVVDQTVLDYEPEPVQDPDEQWSVDARWLLGLDEYNEWMNEGDYLYDVSIKHFFKYCL